MHTQEPLHTRIVRIDGSLALRLSSEELKGAGLGEGDEVHVLLSACDHSVDWEALPLRRQIPQP